MTPQVHPVDVKAVVPTATGAALFLGNDEKTFVIYIDSSVGAAINNSIHGRTMSRPMTHDLMGHLMAGLGAKVERAIINDVKSGTFYARLIISAENELHQRKIVELDARPSDAIALAAQQKAPVYVTRDVWEEVEDASDALRQIESTAGESGPDEEASEG